MDVIPVSRTASPYSLTEAVSELTTNTAGTDTASLNQSLDTLSETLDQVAPQLGPTFDGITRLSQAINDRDDTLGELLEDGADVTKILVRPQRTGEHPDPQRQRSRGGAQRAAARDRRVARPHVGVVEAAVRPDPRQRGEAGADAGQAQRGDGDAGEEPRQYRQGAAGAGEIPDHPRRDDRQRPVLPGVRPEPRLSARSSSRSSTTRSASDGAPTPVSRPTMPGLAPSFPSRTTGFLRTEREVGATAAMTRNRFVKLALAAVLAVALVGGVAVVIQHDLCQAEDDHRLLHQDRRHLSRRRGPHRRRQGGHHRLDPTDRHAGQDDPARRPRDFGSRRRQGGDRRPEPGLRPLRPTRARLRVGPDDAGRRRDPARPHRNPRRVGRSQRATDAAGNGFGPGQRHVDRLGRAVHRQRRQCAWTATATSCVRRWLSCPGVGRILADGSGNIVDTITNLQTFVTALRDSNDQIVQFQDRFATLTSVVNDSRSDLDAALKNLSDVVGETTAIHRKAPATRPPSRSSGWPTSPRTWPTTAWTWRTSCTSRRTRLPTPTTCSTRAPVPPAVCSC